MSLYGKQMDVPCGPLLPAVSWWSCWGLAVCGFIWTNFYVNVSFHFSRINAQGAIAGLDKQV